jgi:hypothetical protein
MPSWKAGIVDNKDVHWLIKKNERDINPSAALTSLGVALFSGLQSGLIPIPCSPKPLAEKAQTRTCMVACEQAYHPER